MTALVKSFDLIEEHMTHLASFALFYKCLEGFIVYIVQVIILRKVSHDSPTCVTEDIWPFHPPYITYDVTALI